ncbi:MAG: hypothetical protein IJT34_06045, partial [Butyrivibrio sp.]|nr:hypothetical protein [Butyrivibrio sp.]
MMTPERESMNSKKLVSLLSAGALVVSSFSGLVMNGGVARAAIVGAYDDTGAALAEIGDGDEAYILATEAGDAKIEVGVANNSTHYFAGATTAADGVAGQVIAQAVEYNGMTFGMDDVDGDTDEITVTKGTGQKDAVITYENAAAFTGAKKSITVHQLDAALYDADTDEKAKAKYTLDIRVDGGAKTFKLNTAMADGADTWTLMGDGKDSFDV